MLGRTDLIPADHARVASVPTPPHARDTIIPNIPGYRSNARSPRQRNATYSTFGYKDGGATSTTPGRRTPRGGTPRDDAAASVASSSGVLGESQPPKWLRNQNKVLKFEAYFKESVSESSQETYRVRQCAIFYYLEDDSIAVNEYKTENSGVPQGALVKRHRIARLGASAGRTSDDIGSSEAYSGTAFLDMSDLVLGQDINIYSRVFRITECDAFTRDYLNLPNTGAPETAPIDPYAQHRAETTVGKQGPDVDHRKQLHPLKRFMEASLGNASPRQRTGVNPAEPDKLKRFLEHDRQVLHFLAVWDDRDSLYGDRMFYKVNLFLADDTVEVLEVLSPNCGRDPYPCFVKRQRVRKKRGRGDGVHDSTGRGVNVDYDPEDYYTWKDLCVGTTVNINEREIFLYDCNDFTRDYLLRETGVDMKVLAVDIAEPSPPARVAAHPPPTGFGSEEDSMGSVYHLSPRVPRKDFGKIMAETGNVLRFKAKMVIDGTGAPARGEDQERDFLISYYIADDTITVYEPPVRNSGHMGGKFMERNRPRKGGHASGSGGSGPVLYYGIDDITVGSTIILSGHHFTILDEDDYSTKYRTALKTGGPKPPPRMARTENVKGVLDRLQEIFRGQAMVRGGTEDLHVAFRGANPNKDGTVSVTDLERVLGQHGIVLPEEDLIAVMRYYDRDGSGLIDYNEFVDEIAGGSDYGDYILGGEGVGGDEKHTEQDAHPFRHGASGVGGDGGEDHAEYLEYRKVTIEKSRTQEAKQRLRKLMERFKVVLEQLGTDGVRQEFLKLDDDRSATITVAKFKKGLSSCNFTTQEQDLFSEYFFHGNQHFGLNYDHFTRYCVTLLNEQPSLHGNLTRS